LNSTNKIQNDSLTDAQKRYELLTDSVNHPERVKAVQRWKKDRDFYFSSQWEESESKNMQAVGQVDVVFNRIRRAFRNFIANITSGDPTVKFVPIEAIVANNPEFETAINGTINTLDALWTYTWRQSKGKIRQRRSISNQLVSGLGWMGVYLDPKKDYGRGEVLFRNAAPWEIVVDLSSTEPDFSDSEYIAYRTIKSIEEVIEIAKSMGIDETDELIDKIKKEGIQAKDEQDLDTGMIAPDRDDIKNTSIDPGEASYLYKSLVVEYIEYEEIVDVDVAIHKILDPYGMIEEHVFEDDSENFDEDTYRKYVTSNLEGYEYIDYEVGTDQRCELTIQVGRNVELHKEVLPIRGFRWLPFVCEDTENPLSIGEVYFNRPLNKLLNKMFSLIVYSAQTMGTSAKLIGLPGVFGDNPGTIKAFQNNWANPAATVQLEKGRSGESIDSLIKIVPPASMPPALSGILQTIIGEMNDEMGYHPSQSGVFSDTPRTATATQDILAKSDINIKIPVQNIELAMQILSERWLEYCIGHYDYEKPFAIKGNGKDFDVKTFILNSGDGDIVNNLSFFRWNVFTDIGFSMESQRHTMLSMFKELVQLNPVFIKLFLRYSDLPDKFDIIREIDYTKQLEQQNQQVIDQLQELQKEVYTLSIAVDDAEKKVELAKFSGQLQNVLTKLRAEDKIRKNDVSNAIENLTKDVQLSQKGNSNAS